MNRTIRCVAYTAVCVIVPAAIVVGEFTRIVIDATPPANPWVKIIADVDGDNRPDIIVGGSKGPLVWYRNPDWKKHHIAEGGYATVGGSAVDIDNDGDTDIALGGVVWFENPGSEAVASANRWMAHSIDRRRGHDLVAADLDGDGKVDLAMRNQSSFGTEGGREIVLYRQVSPRQWQQRKLDCPDGEGIALADLNDDRKPDIVIGGWWLENSGDPIAGPWTQHAFSKEWNY